MSNTCPGAQTKKNCPSSLRLVSVQEGKLRYVVILNEVKNLGAYLQFTLRIRRILDSSLRSE